MQDRCSRFERSAIKSPVPILRHAAANQRFFESGLINRNGDKPSSSHELGLLVAGNAAASFGIATLPGDLPKLETVPASKE